jgi:TonB-linked SusC/RagA family outer membrane protein
MELNRLIKLLSATIYLGVFFLSNDLYAQQKVVKAKVLDASDGGPLIGVIIRVKENVKNSTVSDKKGEFTIRAQNNDVLVFSYIGYESQEILVSTFKSMEVKLKPSAENLNEVVVVAYGKQERKDITGSVGTVKMDDLTKSPVVSFDQALQGRVAGVTMSSNDGQLGTDLNIVVRGANSVTQNNSPLYVIDGFPTEDFSASTINPNDVASITILKDASATAIYGSRGANGVVIIETKSGKTGKVKMSFSNSFGIQNVVKTMDVMDPYNYVKYMLELNPNAKDIFLTPEGLTLDDYKKKPSINWQDQLFRTAPMQNHYVSMSGGTQQTKYWVSGSIADQKGVIDHSRYTRYNGQMRLDQRISKKLSVDMNLSYSSDRTLGAIASELSESGPQSQQYQSYLMFRVWGYRPVLVGQTSYDDMFEDISSLSTLNPIMSNANEHREVGRNNLRFNAKLQYQILPSLSFLIRGGIVQNQNETDLFYNSKTYSGFPSANNSRGVNGSYNLSKQRELLAESTLEYKKVFNRDHSLSMLSGFSIQSYNSNRKGHAVWQIPYEEFGMAGLMNGRPNNVVSIIDENKLMSAFARVNYSYKSKYILTSTLRTDGSSKFSKNNRWGVFPSVAAAWNLSKEKFMESLSFIDDAKLRTSWGVTGNNRIASYAARGTIGVGEYTSFNNGFPVNSATILSLENENLSWEETTQINLGYDMSLFKNRIALTFDLYRKTSNNLLLNADVPFSTGQEKAFRNIGSVRNEGLEIGLNVVNINKKNFKWSSDFNISFNRSKVLGLNDGQEKLFSNVRFTGDFNNTNLYVTEVGAPITSFYGLVYDGVYQISDFDFKYGKYELKPSVPTNGVLRENIQPGDPRFIDFNGDGTITDADNTRIGRALPIHSGGFNNNFDYKNWSLNVFFQWNYGNMIMNANRIALEGNYQNVAINQYASYINRWSEDNRSSNIPRTRAQGPTGFYSTRTLEDGSYLRLKTVQLSYKLPKKLLKSLNIANAGINIACQNLFTWSNYSGIDPEVSVRNSTLTTGFDYSAYARNRMITAGLKLDF